MLPGVHFCGVQTGREVKICGHCAAEVTTEVELMD